MVVGGNAGNGILHNLPAQGSLTILLAVPDHVDFKAFTVILQCLKNIPNCVSMICIKAF